MHPKWLVVTIGAMLLELVANYLLPRHYARLAALPFTKRELPLPRVVSQSGYRGASWATPDVGSLGLDGLAYEDDEAVGRFEHGQGWLRMRYKLLGWNRAMGIVSITARIEGETLHLESRLYPMFALGLLPFAFAYAATKVAYAVAAGVVMGLVFGTFMLRRRAAGPLARYLDALEARVAKALAVGEP